jgi:O-antigen/teichoic acid export membrane protein
VSAILTRYAALVAANLASGALGFATASLIARQFGPAGLGATALAASIITYATTITTCGTEIAAVKTGAAEPHNLARLASSVILIRLSIATVVYASLIGLTFVVPAFREIRVLIWLFGLSVFTISGDVSWVSQAIHRTNAMAVATVTTQALALAMLAGALMFSSDLRAVPAARVVAEAVVALGFIVWMRRHVTSLMPPMLALETWSFLRTSAPIGGTQLLRGLALGSDLVLLGLFVGREQLGIYAAAFRVFQLLLGLTAAYFIILLPRIAERRNDSAAMAEELGTSFRRVLPVAIVALALLAVSGWLFFRLLFGVEFVGAATSLRVLLVALIINVSLRHYRQVLLARGLERIDFGNSVVASVVHVAAKLLLIPLFGITGAALGTLIGESVLFLMQRRAALQSLAGQSIAPVSGSSR